MEPRLRVISLGVGVQSTTLALMAAHGEVAPMPDYAIAADTGWEGQAFYDYLAWLESGNVLPFPIIRVNAGNLRDDLIARSSARCGQFITIPAFLLHPDGKHGIGRRQCTSHYKVEPIRRKVRELLGKGPRQRIPFGAVEKWIGISVDEVIRATPSKVAFEVNRFPLLEKRMSRRDCESWLKRHEYPVPAKSSCIGCPFHDQAFWRDMKANRPDEWRNAVEVDAAVRVPLDRKGVPTLRGAQYLHRQRVPLDEVDLSTLEDLGQGNLFLHECEGMCGV